MDLWVFGYGSLLWDPGFVPAQKRRARLHNYHRSFCMLSIHHRGTEEKPGLVLALDHAPGAQCTGMAFKVRDEEQDVVIANLRERELVSSAYYEDTVDLVDDAGQAIRAVTYIVDRDHRQYCAFDLEQQAQMIAHAVGGRGPNTQYLHNTALHLRDMGITDKDIDWLDQRVRLLVGKKAD